MMWCFDVLQANLRSAAYEALMEMVKNSPRDCYVTVQRTTMVILERLQQVLQMETHIQSHSDRAQYNDLQSLLCATLQVSSSQHLHLQFCFGVYETGFTAGSLAGVGARYKCGDWGLRLVLIRSPWRLGGWQNVIDGSGGVDLRWRIRQEDVETPQRVKTRMGGGD